MVWFRESELSLEAQTQWVKFGRNSEIQQQQQGLLLRSGREGHASGFFFLFFFFYEESTEFVTVLKESKEEQEHYSSVQAFPADLSHGWLTFCGFLLCYTHFSHWSMVLDSVCTSCIPLSISIYLFIYPSSSPLHHNLSVQQGCFSGGWLVPKAGGGGVLDNNHNNNTNIVCLKAVTPLWTNFLFFRKSSKIVFHTHIQRDTERPILQIEAKVTALHVMVKPNCNFTENQRVALLQKGK